MTIGSLVGDDNLTGVSSGYLHQQHLTSYIGAQAWSDKRYSINLKNSGSKNERTHVVSSAANLLARWLILCAAWTFELPYYILIRETARYEQYYAAAQRLLDGTFGHRLTLHRFIYSFD